MPLVHFKKNWDMWQGLNELSMFFQGRDEVHKSARRLVQRLEKAKIPYAILGGMALFAHKYRRATNDVDILPTLIQLKLAARRYRDFGDVVELIRFNNLDESFMKQLHPSVRDDYIECLEEKRREDEYEARP